MKEKYMTEAAKEAYTGIENGHGGPFGSVIVKDDKIVGRGHNRVLYKQDPTCHGEMEAIRDACKTLGTHDLSGVLVAFYGRTSKRFTMAAAAKTPQISAFATMPFTTIWKAGQNYLT